MQVNTDRIYELHIDSSELPEAWFLYENRSGQLAFVCCIKRAPFDTALDTWHHLAAAALRQGVGVPG
jgi:hypothetical protein